MSSLGPQFLWNCGISWVRKGPQGSLNWQRAAPRINPRNPKDQPKNSKNYPNHTSFLGEISSPQGWTTFPGLWWSPHFWKCSKTMRIQNLGTWVRGGLHSAGSDLILEGFSHLNNSTVRWFRAPGAVIQTLLELWHSLGSWGRSPHALGEHPRHQEWKFGSRTREFWAKKGEFGHPGWKFGRK